jgi:hypothetical protein
MKTKSWFRVVVDAKGKAVDCKPVGGAGTAERGVFFVLAETAKDAARLAGNEQARRLLAARRARYDAEGLCRCGGKRDTPGMVTCARCRERQKVRNARSLARARGEVVPPLDRRVVLQERKQSEQTSIRLETLVEVQRNYLKMRGQGATFERWLAKQIEAITSGKVAA